MGATVDVTEMPTEYKELEAKVEKIKFIHDHFLSIARNYGLPNYDYEPALKEKVNELANSLSDKANFFASQVGMTSASTASAQPKLEIPPSLSHAFARISNECASLLDPQSPLCKD